METARIIDILKPLNMAYHTSKASPDTLCVYAIALSELTEAELQAGVLRCMRTCKFFPSIAEIMEASREVVDAANGDKAKDGDEAWDEVQRAVRYWIYPRDPQFSTEQIKSAVNAIGWMSFVECESKDINTLRAQFLRIYESICKRKKDERVNADVLKLVGGMKLIGE